MSVLSRLARRARWMIRDLRPNRVVTRDVQGVMLQLPWSHRLPDYAKVAPEYGQNLVRLASALASGDEPLRILDIGANVGDSAAQILAAADARILCVEADRYYLDYLRRNVGGHASVTIREALVTPESSHTSMAPVRTGGTARFEPGASSSTAQSVTPQDLRNEHPEFSSLRLVKSDTDGYDVVLIPAVAAAWSASTPVLFFEYDPKLSRRAGNSALAVWPQLAELGYETVAIWDNFARPLGIFTIDEALRRAEAFENENGRDTVAYWDVAAVHGADHLAVDAVKELLN